MTSPTNPTPGLAQRIAEKIDEEMFREHVNGLPYPEALQVVRKRVQAELANDPVLREAAAIIEDLITTIDSEPTRTVRVSRREVTQLKQALAKLDALMKGSK